ncbi:hypothetical protein BJ165DRAFT_1430026 [Panaeolus papilionaceus]|nr:hypothetical protein BJ165DRAFT_1430026 [Panaeolus papilionaceus]
MDRQLFALLRGFYALTSVNKLQFPKGLSPSVINEFLLSDILLDPHFQQYPPSRQFQKQFWKWAIANLEQMPIEADDDEEFEVDMHIYKHYFALLPPCGPIVGSTHPETRDQTCGRGIAFHTEAPSSSYVTHFWTTNLGLDPAVSDASGLVDLRDYRRTTILESRTMIEGGTTGLRTWLASFVLAQYLINHPDIVSSSRVLELGSGTGFLGIIVATLQLWNRILSKQSEHALWLTDVNEEVLARCQDNLNLPCNELSTSVDITFSELDWADSIDPQRALLLESVIQDKIKPNLILGADVVCRL